MKTLLGFIHIEKTAGTSLNQYLTRSVLGFHPCLSSAFSYTREFDQDYMQADELARIHRFYPLLKGISGHSLRSNVGYGDGSLLLKYFTFLREPVSRVVSQFHYHREVMKINWEFDEFLDNGSYNNLMCRRICGVANAEAAIIELKKRYFFVGLLERYDESMCQFRALSSVLGYTFKNVEIASRNVRAQSGANPFVITKALRERVKQLNAEDMKLYQYVQASGPSPDGTVCWGDVTRNEGPVQQYSVKDYSIGWINRLLSVAYCRRLEYIFCGQNIRNLSLITRRKS